MRTLARAQRGFTLVELVVVIAIIGLLMALLLPAVQSSRETARKVACVNNLKQIGIAMHNYHEAHRMLPPGWIGPTGWGWGSLLLPQLDNGSLYRHLHAGSTTDFPPDAGSSGDVSLPVFICPSDLSSFANKYYSHDGITGYAKSNYAGVNGDSRYILQLITQGTGIFSMSSNTSFKSIHDGTSQTLMVGERKYAPERSSSRAWRGAIWIRAINFQGNFMMGSAVLGTCGGRSTPNARNSRIIGFGGPHLGDMTNFLLADGHVRGISPNIAPSVYRNLANKDDGAVVGEF